MTRAIIVLNSIVNAEKKLYEQEMRTQSRVRNEKDSEFSKQRSRMQPLRTVDDISTKEAREIVDPFEDNWCYHCATPMSHLSPELRKTIQQFLEIRRTSYPSTVATHECLGARNFSKLHKQKCRHRYCETISLIDHDEAASFVLRGCAENFGAIDTTALEAREDNTCTRLHNKLDIHECICREQKYCRFSPSSSTTSAISILLLILTVTLL